jgi:hypothetical protein
MINLAKRGASQRTIAWVLGLCALVVSASGCQPLYGGKAEKIATPTKKKRPPDATTETVKIVYDEECKVDFHAIAIKGQNPMPNQADPLVSSGNTAMDAARRGKDPQEKVNSIIEAINKYKNALVKDPYNAEATLRLAEAYDAVQKKGCALALLKRLADLQTYQPPSSDIARIKVDEVAGTDSMFKGYRNDAMKAIGR